MTARFDKVTTELDFPKEEKAILQFWKDARIFEKSLAKTANGTPFVFYEGPPTANGLPHNGHVLTRVIKDLFPRYKTMQGYHVPRKAGWDTHGLPGRGRSGEGAPHPRQGGHRRIRHGALREEVHRLRVPLHEGMGGPHGARRVLGRPADRVRHVPQVLRRVGVVGALETLRERGSSIRVTRSFGGGPRAAPRSPRRRSVRATRTSTIPPSTSRSPLLGRRRFAPRLDDDAVDLAIEHVRGRQSRNTNMSSSPVIPRR